MQVVVDILDGGCHSTSNAREDTGGFSAILERECTALLLLLLVAVTDVGSMSGSEQGYEKRTVLSEDGQRESDGAIWEEKREEYEK